LVHQLLCERLPMDPARIGFLEVIEGKRERGEVVDREPGQHADLAACLAQPQEGGAKLLAMLLVADRVAIAMRFALADRTHRDPVRISRFVAGLISERDEHWPQFAEGVDRIALALAGTQD